MRVIYVDDELPARENFRYTIAQIPEVTHLELFQDGEDALDYVKNHQVHMAFLDMEMPGLHGLALALKLKELDDQIRIVFVTAYSQYALDAWKVHANGYVLKPYFVEDIKEEIARCKVQVEKKPSVLVQTIPSLALSVDGKAIQIPGDKTRELFALLVDQGDHGVSSGEGIACLWPDRADNNSTKSLFRMTYKRLADALEEAGIGHIIASTDKRRYVKVEEIDCDLYRILSGDTKAALKYNGQYLTEYSWAEERNGQLYRMLNLE